MRQTHVWGSKIFKSGDTWDICDRCGFDYYSSQLVKEEITGLHVCKKCEDEPDRESEIRRRIY